MLRSKNLWTQFLSIALMAVMMLTCLMPVGMEQAKADASDPVTIKILTTLRDASGKTTVDDVYLYHYLEYHMREQGYNVTLEVEDGGVSPNERLSVLLNTGDLPDLIFGINLTTAQVVNFGVTEGMLLDWTPYMNDPEIMPCANELITSHPEVLIPVTCSDGKIYQVPFVEERVYMWAAGNGAGSNIWINEDWLNECGLELPQTSDELLDLMRTFSEKKQAEGGDGVVYVPASRGSFEFGIWSGLGYYGTNGIAQHGTDMMIKDGKVELPAATEDYRKYIEIMHTLYSEGLVPEDYYTIDGDTANAMVRSLDYPVIDSPWAFEANVEAFTTHFVNLPPFTVGDNTTVAASVRNNVMRTAFGSANTGNPEMAARLMDILFDTQGGIPIALYGPKAGEDPLGLVDGWEVKDGQFTTKLVEDGTYPVWENYALAYILGPQIGNTLGVGYALSRNEDGTPKYLGNKSYTDAITGEEVELVIKQEYPTDTLDGAQRHKKLEAWEGHHTTVLLPEIYVDDETVDRLSELSMLITDQIRSESVKFITGLRPLDEIDQYFEELKGIGLEEYVDIYRTAYEPYMNSVFGN